MIGDTIQAISSPRGAGARAVLRVSGPEAFAAVGRLTGKPIPQRRGSLETQVSWRGHKVPCLLLHMPGPASYSGEDLVELHLPGSPMLLTLLGETLAPECRPASPGEFTRRAFENGRLDLAGAQGVMDLIHAESAAERRRALALVQGELQAEVSRQRGKIQDALALLEAGLDFEAGETGEISADKLEVPLAAAEQALSVLEAGLPAARRGAGILVHGAANAGKSSLCNALAGREEVLVDATAGSTRDLLAIELEGGQVILDSPGEHCEPSALASLVGEQRTRAAQGAGAAILVLDGQNPQTPQAMPAQPVLALVLSKQDLGSSKLPPGLPALPVFATSARTGEGIDALRRFLSERSSGGPAGEGQLLRSALGTCLKHLRLARSPDLGASPELAALELSAALLALELIDGRSSPEDLLDRIFAGFCLGK